MQSCWSYIQDSGDSAYKIKRLGRVCEDSFLITTDVVSLYPSMPRKEGILALKGKSKEQTFSKIPTKRNSSKKQFF